MNVKGAEVERRLGRSLMPRLHAGFSLGLGDRHPLSMQLLVTAVLVPVTITPAARRFSDDRGVDQGRAANRSRALTAWREPRTQLIGLMALGFAFT